MRFGLKKILLFLLLFPLAIFSQEDIGITNMSIVGAAAGPSLCPNSEVSIDLTFANTKGAPYTLDGKTVRIFTTHTSNATAAFNAVIDNGGRIVPAAGNLVLRYPRDFTGATALDLSVHGIYTITASITVLNDDDSSNDVFALNNITAYTPTDSALSSTVAGVSTSTLCEGEAITFEITPDQATATYVFKLNGDIKQSAVGNNTITFSSAGANAIANGDVITIEMTDENGCTVNSATESITVSVNTPPIASLTSNAPEGYFCDGETITFTATGVGSYTWYIDNTPVGGATGSIFSATLSDNQTVKVRVTNSTGCYDEKSITLQKLTATNDGLIVLSDANDLDICTSEDPDQILGDGTGGSAVGVVSDGVVQYQWQSSLNGTDFVDIEGANTANYDPGPLTATTYFRRNIVISPGTKRCVQEGADVVVINVRPPFDPGLSTSDPLNTFCQNETITVSANSGAANYNFFVNGVSQQSGAGEQYIIKTGATRNLGVVPDILQNGDNIRVDVTDNFGCITSQSIALVVDETGLNPTLSTNKSGNIICAGDSVQFTATGGASYTFFINTPGNPATPAEVVGNIFTTNRLVDNDVVTARVYNATGCYVDVSETFQVLTLTDEGAIRFTVGADANICYGALMAGTIDGDGAPPAGSVVASGSDSIGYQWQSSVDGENWGNIDGATSANYAPPGNFTITTRFKRIAFTYVDSNGNTSFDEDVSCGNIESNVLTVNVASNFDLSLTTGVPGNLFCAGTSATITAASGATQYEFRQGGVNVQGPGAARSYTAVTGNGGGQIDDGDLITVIATIGGCTYTQDIVINVDFFGSNAVASLISDKLDDSICENESTVFTAGPAGQANYEFFIGAVSKQSGADNTFTTTEINQDQTVRVVITNAAGCTDDETITVSVARNTTPGTIQIDTDGNAQGDAITHSICDGDAQPLIDGTAPGGAIATSSDQVIYRWAYSINGGATFVPIAGQTGSDLAAGTINITQTTIIRRTSYATITGTNLLCDPRSDEVTLTVTDRTLTLNAAETSGVANDNEICSGDTITFTAAGNQAGDTIQWLVDGIAPAGALTDPGNVITYPETALVSGQQVSFRITTNAGSGACVFESTPITVIVTDPPAATLSSDKTSNAICENESIVFTALPAGQANYEFFIDGVRNQSFGSRHSNLQRKNFKSGKIKIRFSK